MKEQLDLYWRKDWFESLKNLANIDNSNQYEEYRQYCIHLEKGLRKRALKHLSNFVDWIKTQDFSDRLEFVRWIFPIANESPNFEQLIPHPLLRLVAEPTLAEFIDTKGGDADAFYWLGIITGDSLFLKQAIAKDPSHVDCRMLMINRGLNFIDHATHHLPEYLIGNVQEVIEELNYLQSLFSDLLPPDKLALFKNEVITYREMIKKQRNFGEQHT